MNSRRKSGDVVSLPGVVFREFVGKSCHHEEQVRLSRFSYINRSLIFYFVSVIINGLIVTYGGVQIRKQIS